ncbi:MAG: hypothetical protein HOU81_16675 [Hamadaea sp.]|uniref:MAB_1171c family putative transporter n=1 Tax=Hamadaea sp. TaxID=2024425 RepID=UPI00184A490C|nr:MAB_1171c family putative transporter [Hamadaea sp.]NUR72452.1 hypothetical protein [Hamadaea sp.]NUT22232.1 hypothetical protein [Hamadaea sp.]
MTVADVAVLALLWSVGLVRLVRRRPSAHHRVMTFSLLAIAVAATAHEPAIAQALDSITGVADLAVGVRTLSGVVAAASVWVFAEALSGPAEPRAYWRPRLYVIPAVVLGCLTVLFWTAVRLPGPGSFTDEQSGHLPVVLFGVFSYLMYAAAAGRGAVLFWTQARTVGRTLLRTGLYVLCVAAGLFLAYVALRALWLVGESLGRRPPPWLAEAQQGELTLGFLLLAVGCGLPGLAVARDYVADYAALNRLHHLWHTLQRAVPGFVLGRTPSRLGDQLNPLNVKMRLYRRVIEIRDAQWSLGAPVDPDPTTEAALLLMALAVAGKSAAKGTSNPRVRIAWPRNSADPGDAVNREVAHLLLVAEYFASAFPPLLLPPRQLPRLPDEDGEQPFEFGRRVLGESRVDRSGLHDGAAG